MVVHVSDQRGSYIHFVRELERYTEWSGVYKRFELQFPSRVSFEPKSTFKNVLLMGIPSVGSRHLFSTVEKTNRELFQTSPSSCTRLHVSSLHENGSDVISQDTPGGMEIFLHNLHELLVLQLFPCSFGLLRKLNKNTEVRHRLHGDYGKSLRELTNCLKCNNNKQRTVVNDNIRVDTPCCFRTSTHVFEKIKHTCMIT